MFYRCIVGGMQFIWSMGEPSHSAPPPHKPSTSSLREIRSALTRNPTLTTIPRNGYIRLKQFLRNILVLSTGIIGGSYLNRGDVWICFVERSLATKTSVLLLFEVSVEPVSTEVNDQVVPRNRRRRRGKRTIIRQDGSGEESSKEEQEEQGEQVKKSLSRQFREINSGDLELPRRKRTKFSLNTEYDAWINTVVSILCSLQKLTRELRRMTNSVLQTPLYSGKINGVHLLNRRDITL